MIAGNSSVQRHIRSDGAVQQTRRSSDKSRQASMVTYSVHVIAVTLVLVIQALLISSQGTLQQHPEVRRLQEWRQAHKSGDSAAGAAFAGQLPHDVFHLLIREVHQQAKHHQQQGHHKPHTHDPLTGYPHPTAPGKQHLGHKAAQAYTRLQECKLYGTREAKSCE